jgi:aldose 1-epimerase
MDRVVLQPRAGAQHADPAFVDLTFLPSRGMRLHRARARFSNQRTVDLIDGALSFAGAILLPFANRIRGRLEPGGTTLDTSVLGGRVRLPANWRGQRPGAAQCAMHGLLFDVPMRVVECGPHDVVATLDAGDFDGHWPSRTFVRVAATLDATSLQLSVTAQNTGREPLPVGIGWHPYFTIPSGDREHARLHLPAARRARVTNYDDVFPTGEIVAVAGTPYDFTAEGGAPLGTQYFDDMFVDLEKTSAGHTQIELHDAASAYRMRLTALSRQVTAVQVYSPPSRSFVVIEPQFNWADPFSGVWPADTNTGMVVLSPDADVTWAARWELLSVENL